MSRCACHACITKRTYQLNQRDILTQPHEEPISQSRICTNCQEYIKYTALHRITRLYLHFDTCPCDICSERRVKHFRVERYHCVACRRASFGRCTAELHTKVTDANSRRDDRRQRRQQRHMEMDMYSEMYIEMQQRNEYSTE